MTDVRMNYGSMEKMAKEFDNAAKQIEDSTRDMRKIAKMMDDGGLKGDGGQAFNDAIMQKLVPKMKQLEEKMQELSRDINGAVAYTRDGVQKAKNKFTD
jgi:WXG100 family type VII secretion target